ncbi:MAG: hypothetical protein AB7G37_04630 [Solirubrobacteraceae bacterium]
MSDTPPYDDTEIDLPDEGWVDGREPSPPAPNRSRFQRLAPIVLAAVVLVGVGFIGGVQVQKGRDDGGGGFGARATAGGFPGGGGVARGGAPAGGGTPGGGTSSVAGGAGGGSASGAGGGSAGTTSGVTVGTVKNVKGTRMVVEDGDGTTVEVRVGDQAKVQRLSHSSVNGVHPGDTVIVQGTSREDGGVTATNVQATAPGITALVGAMGRGMARAAGGGAGASSGSGPGSSSGGGSSSSGDGSSSGDDVDQLFNP